MSQKRLWIAAAIIALVIGTSFILSVPHTTRDTVPTHTSAVVTPQPIVALRDSYKKGKHTFTGSFMAPNACAEATTTASFVDDASTTPHILLDIAVSNDPGVCLQLPTSLTLGASLLAPAGLPITVTVNGVVASTTAL